MINFTGWKYYKSPTGENIGITIKNGDVQESRSLQDPDVVKWLEEGNTPLPAENT
jgi:hypothetical protein